MRSLRILIAAALALVALVVVVRLASPPPSPAGHELLRNVYSPRFRTVPTPLPATEIRARAWKDLGSEQGRAFLRRWLPSQGGTLWLALIVTLIVGFDFSRPRHPRNLDLVLLQLLGIAFFDILSLARRLQDPYWLGLLWWIFDAIVMLSVLLAARAVWRVFRPFNQEWQPAMSGRVLMALALALLALDVTAALVREIDDSGYFVNLGAQRLRERGRLPYGDPLLTGTPGAAYPPLLYVAHLPFQVLVDPQPVNRISTPNPPLGNDSTYYLPSPLATKLCVVAFQLLAAAMLWAAGGRFGTREIGWALVALYCGSPFVLGIGGEEYFIGGMTYVSHIAPPALTTAAFLALSRPAVSGSLLVVAIGCGFYPAFLVPAWAGYYWERRRRLVVFLAAVVVCAIALTAFVLLLSRPAGGRGLIGTILWDTLGHHTDPAGYGSSPFGFWGQRGGWRQWMMTPLVAGSGLSAPAMVLLCGASIGTFFVALRRSAQALALVSAAVVIGATLVKIHPTGGYVAWFLPFLLLGLFLPGRAPASAGPDESRS